MLTCRRHYGTDSHMQNAEFFSNNLKRLHRIKRIRVGDRKFYLQGYEPQALKYMLQNGVALDQVSDEPIAVKYWCTESHKTRTYHPDFILANDYTKLFVEIKSVYTARLDLDTNTFSKNIKNKRKGVLKAEYDYVMVVLSGKGNYVRHVGAKDKLAINDEKRFKDILDCLACNLLI